MHKHQVIVGGLVSLVLTATPINAQNASIPTEKPVESFLKYSDSKTREVVRRLEQAEEIKYKDFLDKFLKCDGNNGNSEMTEYSDPDYYHVIDGKCVYMSQGGM